MPNLRINRRLQGVALAAFLLLLAACRGFVGLPAEPECIDYSCGSGGGALPATPAPPEKWLEVTTITTGSNIDSDGYYLSIQREGAGWAWGIAANTTWEFGFGGGGGGVHTVSLTGVAANCAVAGDNPRTVEIAVGGKASTTFEISCE